MKGYTVQVIINGGYEFVKELTLEQIDELQNLLKQFNKEV